MVANTVKGKALEVYDMMSIDDLEDCEEFKADILISYKLWLETYRL